MTTAPYAHVTPTKQREKLAEYPEVGRGSHEQSRCALKGRNVEALPQLRILGETTPVVVLPVWARG